MKTVISASRRTDIPGLYAEWFINRIKAGYLYVQNPFSKKWIYVSLKPEDICAIVLWSKNFSPMLKLLEKIEGATKNIFFHLTITGAIELESNTPDYRDAIKDFIFIAARYSPEQIVWRFDPICITNKLSLETYEERFIKYAERLRGYARICYISFVNPYKKVIKNLKNYTDHYLIDISSEKKREFAMRLANIAEGYKIKLYACCNDYLLSEKVSKGSCINGDYLTSIFRTHIDAKKTPLRKECACTKSIDIGAYDTCAHGCVYCYATTDKEEGTISCKRQDLDWNALGMNITEDESPSLLGNYLSGDDSIIEIDRFVEDG